MIWNKRNIRNDIVEYVREQILEGEWRKGDKLPPQDQLAKQLGISRTSLREALYKLNSLGLVEIQHGKGTFITSSFSNDHMLNSLGLIILQQDDIKTLFEARRYIEMGTAYLAAKRRTENEIVKLQEIVSNMEQEMDKPKIFGELDTLFHITIARMSKNVILLHLLEAMREVLRKQQEEVRGVIPAVENALTYHRKIFQAIMDKHPEKAQQLMLEHMVRAEEIYDAYVSSIPLKKD